MAVSYPNPFPNYANVGLPSNYTYPNASSGVLGIRWGLSRGALLNPPLLLRTVTPETGPAAGGTTVILRGTGFRIGDTVTFGGTPATTVLVMNSTLIIAVTPAHAAGAVDVVVHDPGGGTSTKVGGFTYT